MKKFLTLIFLSIVCWQSYAFTYAFTARVIKIIGAKTFDVITTEKYGRKELTVHVRLYGIDCPEHDQPFGKEAIEFVRKSLSDKKVTIDSKIREKDNRIIGIVTIIDSNINLNEELLKKGLAWVYPKYCKDNRYYDLQKEAKEKQLNIWSDTHPIAPWDWRGRQLKTN